MFENLTLVWWIFNRSWLLHETFQSTHTDVNLLQCCVYWRLNLVFKSALHVLFDFRYEALMLLDKIAQKFSLTGIWERRDIFSCLLSDISHVYKVAYFFVKEHIEDLNLQKLLVWLIILFYWEPIGLLHWEARDCIRHLFFAIVLFSLFIVCWHDIWQALLAIRVKKFQSVWTQRLECRILLLDRRKYFVLDWMRLSAESLTFCLVLFLVILTSCEVSSKKVFCLFVWIYSFGRFFVASPGNDQNFVWHVVEQVLELILLWLSHF